jgi:hypothetical protein
MFEQRAGSVIVRNDSPSFSTLLVTVVMSRMGLAPHCIPLSSRMLQVMSSRLFISTSVMKGRESWSADPISTASNPVQTLKRGILGRDG